MLWIILALALWGLLHSWTASLSFKASFEKLFGEKIMRFYRLGYNAFSAISLLPILYLIRILPDAEVYTVAAPWSYVMFAGRVVAVIGLFVGVFQTDTLAFIGLRQIIGLSGDERGKLVVKGLYQYVRHPLYTFGLLFIWLTSYMTENWLTVYIGATIYIVIGAYFEERKLLREFGEEYAAYKARTPMLLPKFW